MSRPIQFAASRFAAVRSSGAVGALAAVLLVCGCAGPAGPASPVPEVPAEVVAGVDCLAPNLGQTALVYPAVPTATDVTVHPDAPAAGDVPADFDPVTLTRCTYLDTVEDERGLWSAVTVETLTGDFDRLLSAFAEPDDEAVFHQACTADMEFVPELWLQDAAGDSIRAAWPVTACGKTKPATHEVIGSFTVTATEKLPLAMITSREALDAGCTMQASIPVWGGLMKIEYPPLVDANTTPGTSTPEDVATDSSTSANANTAGDLCLYSVDPASTELEPIPGADAEMQQQLQDAAVFIVSGSFSGAVALPAATRVRLEGAASGAALPAADCDTVASRFAQVGSSPSGSAVITTPITVELDGCERVFSSTGTAFEMPDDLSAAHAGL